MMFFKDRASEAYLLRVLDNFVMDIVEIDFNANLHALFENMDFDIIAIFL